MNKFLLPLAIVMIATFANAQEDVVIKRDTVRDTIVVREVIREYVLTNDTSKLTSKPEKKKLPIKLHFDFRGGWSSDFDARSEAEREFDGSKSYSSAFTGKYLQFYIDGYLTEGLSYHYRQRLNRLNSLDALFTSIDKAFLRYEFKSGWGMAAGKFPLAIGGWEYDAAPIDVYFASEFWNHVYCFQLGVRGGYQFKDGKSKIIAEIANSPFNPTEKGMLNNMYGYSLLWYGDFKVFQSSYSVNVFEVMDGTYMGQVVLGNRFIAGPMTIELDWTQRFHSSKNAFGDFTGILNVKGNIKGWANIFAKVDYDQNLTNQFEGMSENEPYWVQYGDKILSYGLGVEVFPIKRAPYFRLHAYWYQSLNVANDDWREYDLKQHHLSVGMTLDFTAFERK